MPDSPPPKLLDQVRQAIRTKGYSIRTEQAYVNWVERFILFHQKRHPAQMGAVEIEAFLTHLAVNANVAASTQNQAFSAILFLYREVLHKELPAKIQAVRAKTPQRLPVVLSKQETRSLLNGLSGVHLLMARLLYGSGLRLMECVRLRVKDIDFERRQIVVRDGKGEKDRVTLLPGGLIEDLQRHLRHVKLIHEDDLQDGFGSVYLPYALERKYPNTTQEWGWQWLFPASKRSIDPRSGLERRHHRDESGLQKAIRSAARKAGLVKPVGPHTLRHCFAAHLLEAGYDIRTVQELLGHKDLSTTMIYTHVLNRGPNAVRSPLDD
ncbi:MAG: integron integrase [Anaerolineales bacterium]|nr:integron integrase [Anaerolineales bacterium]